MSAASRKCPSSITRPPIISAAISLGVGEASEPVEIIPVDTLGLARCDLLKIDVEGMEGEVLAGATSTITRYRPVLYVENDREEKSAPLIEGLLSLDYELFWHLPLPFNPENFFGHTANVFEGIVSFNILGVPREAKRSVPGFARRRATRSAIRQMVCRMICPSGLPGNGDHTGWAIAWSR